MHDRPRLQDLPPLTSRLAAESQMGVESSFRRFGPTVEATALPFLWTLHYPVTEILEHRLATINAFYFCFVCTECG